MIDILTPLLQPIARLSISRGWRFAEVTERLRHAFFDAAATAAGAGATDSRLSVMTGLQRREVARLRGAPEAPAATDPPNHLARIVAQWLARFDGQSLPRRGGAASFDTLARSVHRDVHPRTFLDQLIAAGTVRAEGDQVILVERAYRPLAGSGDQLRYLARNVGDHLTASVENVVARPRFFERAVHYDQLTPEAVAELDALWRARMGEVLAEVNAKAADLQASRTGAIRFRAGTYFYDTRPDPAVEEAAP